MLPGGLLFPGMNPTDPLTARQLSQLPLNGAKTGAMRKAPPISGHCSWRTHDLHAEERSIGAISSRHRLPSRELPRLAWAPHTLSARAGSSAISFTPWGHRSLEGAAVSPSLLEERLESVSPARHQRHVQGRATPIEDIDRCTCTGNRFAERRDPGHACCGH